VGCGLLKFADFLQAREAINTSREENKKRIPLKMWELKKYYIKIYSG